MLRISFEVNKLAIAYIMQLRGLKDFGIGRNTWKKILIGAYGQSELAIVEEIQSRLKN